MVGKCGLRRCSALSTRFGRKGYAMAAGPGRNVRDSTTGQGSMHGKKRGAVRPCAAPSAAFVCFPVFMHIVVYGLPFYHNGTGGANPAYAG